jgi:hypothetical protein
MSNSKMVAIDGSNYDKDRQSLPMFDPKDVVNWGDDIVMWCMTRNRNHLGFERPPTLVGSQHAKHEKAMEVWLERKDTCVSTIFTACRYDAVALEVVKQYRREKMMLPDTDPNKDTLASELLDRLTIRFRGELQDELGELNKQFTQFMMVPGEAVCKGIDRLNGIIQKMNQHQQPPTEQAKVSKLKTALQIDSLKDLWIPIAMQDNPTYDEIVETCKRYDRAIGLRDELQTVHYTTEKQTEKQVTKCSHCGKGGHIAKVCYKKLAEQRKAKAKRTLRSNEKDRNRGGGTGQQRPGSTSYSGCFNCGSSKHLERDCKKKSADSKSDNDGIPSRKKVKYSLDRYVRKSEHDSSEESNMVYDNRDANGYGADELETAFHTDAFDNMIFLDSCASKKLFLLKDQSFLDRFVHSTGYIQTTKSGTAGQLETQGTGSTGAWTDITVCNDAVKNLVGAGYLRKMGYGLLLLHVPKIVRLSDREVVVLVCEYSDNGMPFVSLRDLLLLPDISDSYGGSNSGEMVMFSDQMNQDAFDLLHRRAAHVSESVLIEAFKHQTIEGTGLGRQHLSNRFKKRITKVICNGCARGKQSRVSFTAKTEEFLTSLGFLDVVVSDISVYVNCPDRNGNKYILVFTDVATKYFWEFLLKERTGAEVLRCIKHIVEVELPKFPGTFRWKKYHTDGGKELTDQAVKSYLLEKFGTIITWNTSHTPEQNGVAERKFRTISEAVLTTLRYSGLDVSLWGDCVTAVCMTLRMIPTRTHRGWMSPMECVPGGKVPNLSRLRVWGCKAYVLTPKADRRKDWEEKNKVGHLIGYSTDKKGYIILVGDTIVKSVHVLFDESPPERSVEYYKDFDSKVVTVNPEEKYVSDFTYLIGKYYIDEGLLYVTTRVVNRNGFIVGFRSLILSGNKQIEDKTPIHIEDVKELTELLASRQAVNSGNHDGDTQDASSLTESSGVQPLPTIDPGVTSGESTPPVVVAENNKRVRVKRTLTNCATLGEVHAVEADDLETLVDADECLLTANEYPPEPVTYEESLIGPESKQWKIARQNERRALQQKDVLEAVPKPDGIRPVKSRYVYKRKFDKSGELKKHKARMIALGFGQVQGVDVFNTFAPVVKSITVRLLLAIAFLYNMAVHQLDVSNAFCYADIEGDVYMEATSDYDLPEGWCFKLHKALYGLRTSPRSWWKHLDKYIKSLHFKPCILEPCLYHMLYKGTVMYLMIYVDDILIACSNIDYIIEIKKKFCSKFDMSDMGILEHFLNIRVVRTTNYLQMDQSVYIQKVLDKHVDYLGDPKKTRKNPMPHDAMKKIKEEMDEENPVGEEDKIFIENFPYRTLLGATLYLALNTRPDISYAVGVLSRFANKPTLVICRLMIYMMQYLRGTTEMGIKFSGKIFDMHVHSDADWGGCLLTFKSTTGFIVTAVGGPVSWQSKLQTTVSTSSMQAEYQAIYAGMTELVWLRGVLKEIGLPLS